MLIALYLVTLFGVLWKAWLFQTRLERMEKIVLTVLTRGNVLPTSVVHGTLVTDISDTPSSPDLSEQSRGSLRVVSLV